MNTRKQVNVMIALVFLTLLTVALYWAWDTGRAEKAEERQLEVAADRGAHLFAKNCRLCHARTGKGAAEDPTYPGAPLNIEPNRPTDPTELKSLQVKFTDTLRCGRAGKIMPPWSVDYGGPLNDEQIRQLVLLITTNAGNAWEKELKYSDEFDQQFELAPPPAADDPALITELACGQVAAAPATPVGTPVPLTPAPPEVIAKGFQLVEAFACTACHTTTGEESTGPTWKGLSGSTVTMTDGSSVVVDYSYLRESIVNPSAKVVEGFQNVMPTYTVLTAADIDAIIAYIHSLREGE
ncbi:MAG: c-type cytochrome [Dehalococcoidia bacterium]